MDVDEPLKRLANPKNLVDRIERNARNGRAGASADALQGDELFQSLGDQYAGRFISPSKESQSSEPTDGGFIGVWHSGDGEVFPEGNIVIGGAENGSLNAGFTDDGRLIINSVILNGTELDAGLIRNEAGYITEQNVDNGSEDRTMRIGMIDNGTYAEGRIEFNEPSSSSVTVPNGDFATNDMTDWTVNAGTWDASAGYAVGTGTSAPSIKNTTKIAVTAGNTYNFTGQFSASCLGTFGSATTFTIVTKLDVKFYTVADALVSTVTVGTRTGSQSYPAPDELAQGGASLGWGSITKNILVPATATKFEYVAYINSFSGVSCTLSVDDFTCVQVAAQSAIVMKDGGLWYEKSDGTDFQIKKSLEEVSIKTADEAFDDTTPTNVTDLLFTVSANTKYYFQLTTKITTATAGGTMDAQLSFTFPSGASIEWGAIAGSVKEQEVVSSAFTPNTVGTAELTIGLASNATSIFNFAGFLTVSSTAGTVQLQARQNTSNANTFQIDKASFIRYTDLSGANLASPAYYTDAEAQDAVGSLLTDTATINLTYTANTSITADVIDGSITEAKLEMPTAADTAKVIGWTGTVLDWVSLAASYISDFAATVRATVLTGLSLADSTDVVAGDTVLQAVGKLQAQSDALPAATITLTNKRIQPRMSTAASASSITPDVSSYDRYSLTALAADLTINAPTGTPTGGERLVFRFKDDSTPRAFTWNAIYRAINTTLPTGTTAGKVMYVYAEYNNTETKWDVTHVLLEDATSAGGDISGTGVVGQLAQFVTNTKTLEAAKIIGPTTNILTLTNAAASTLALNITAAKTLTLTAADNYTLTIPATMTAAGLGVANVFTTQQMIDGTSDQIQMRVQGHSTQTQVLQTWENYSGVVQAHITSVGYGRFARIGIATDPAVQLDVVGQSRFVVDIGAYSTTALPNFMFYTRNPTSQTNGTAGVVMEAQNGANSFSAYIGVVAEATRVGSIVFMQRYANGNYYESARITQLGGLVLNGVGDTNQLKINGNSTQTLPLAYFVDNTSATSVIRNVLQIETQSTGTAATGLGAGLLFSLETATAGTNQNAGRVYSEWITATNASRAAKTSITAYDSAGERIGFQVEASGSAAKVSLFGVTPVTRPTALTAADAGAVNTGDATSDAVINNMRIRIGELETKLQSLGAIS